MFEHIYLIYCNTTLRKSKVSNFTWLDIKQVFDTLSGMNLHASLLISLLVCSCGRFQCCWSQSVLTEEVIHHGAEDGFLSFYIREVCANLRLVLAWVLNC